jgi:hypothetical protein
MKHGFIAYGTIKPEWLPLTDKFMKEMERVKEDAAKKGFKMLYWGHPYGVTENVVVVYESDKGLADYHSLNLNNPYTGTRTNLVVIP